MDKGVKIKIELINKKPYKIYIQENESCFDWYINGNILKENKNECNNK